LKQFTFDLKKIFQEILVTSDQQHWADVFLALNLQLVPQLPLLLSTLPKTCKQFVDIVCRHFLKEEFKTIVDSELFDAFRKAIQNIKVTDFGRLNLLVKLLEMQLNPKKKYDEEVDDLITWTKSLSVLNPTCLRLKTNLYNVLSNENCKF